MQQSNNSNNNSNTFKRHDTERGNRRSSTSNDYRQGRYHHNDGNTNNNNSYGYRGKNSDYGYKNRFKSNKTTNEIERAWLHSKHIQIRNGCLRPNLDEKQLIEMLPNFMQGVVATDPSMTENCIKHILWPPLLGNGNTNDLAIFIDIDYPGRVFGLTLPIVCIASRKRLDEGPVVMLVTGRDVEELQSITKTYSKFIKVFYVTDSNETTEPDKETDLLIVTTNSEHLARFLDRHSKLIENSQFLVVDISSTDTESEADNISTVSSLLINRGRIIKERGWSRNRPRTLVLTNSDSLDAEVMRSLTYPTNMYFGQKKVDDLLTAEAARDSKRIKPGQRIRYSSNSEALGTFGNVVAVETQKKTGQKFAVLTNVELLNHRTRETKTTLHLVNVSNTKIIRQVKGVNNTAPQLNPSEKEAEKRLAQAVKEKALYWVDDNVPKSVHRLLVGLRKEFGLDQVVWNTNQIEVERCIYIKEPFDSHATISTNKPITDSTLIRSKDRVKKIIDGIFSKSK